MRVISGLVLWLLVGVPMAAVAQSSPWRDVDCAQSRLALPADFKCKVTDAQEGAQGSGRGQFRRWWALGTVDGATTAVWLYEAVGVGGHSVFWNSSGIDYFRTFNETTAKGTAWMEPTSRDQVLHAQFQSGARKCVAFRRAGPSKGSYYAHLLYGYQCAGGGRSLAADSVVAYANSLHLR